MAGYISIEVYIREINTEVNWNSIDKSILINYTKIDSNLNYFYPLKLLKHLQSLYWLGSYCRLNLITNLIPLYLLKLAERFRTRKGIIDFAKLESNNKFSY